MTTVAWKRPYMVSDSSVTSRHRDGIVDKVYRLSKSGALVGISGDVDHRDVLLLLESVTEPQDLPTRKVIIETAQDFEAMIVFPDEQIWFMNCFANKDGVYVAQVYRNKESFAATGSGGYLALAAMHAGATAKRAVEIACYYDPPSSPPLHIEKL